MQIEFSGQCTVEHAAHLHSQWLSALTQGEDVEVNLQHVTQVDLTFFQLLHAAKQSAGQKGLKLTVLANLSKELADLMHKTGLSALIR